MSSSPEWTQINLSGEHRTETLKGLSNNWHQRQTSRTDIKDRHQGQTSRTDIKDRHQGQTSRTDIKDRHQGQTSRTDIKDRHQGQTSRTDIKDRLDETRGITPDTHAPPGDASPYGLSSGGSGGFKPWWFYWARSWVDPA